MPNREINVLIGGEAGQGLATVGNLLAKCAVRAGYYLVATQGYMSRIRGGHNTFALRIASRKIRASAEKVDMLVALNPETVEYHRSVLAENPLVLAGEAYEGDVQGLVRIPFKDLGSKRAKNVVALGVVANLLGIDDKLVENAVHDAFGKKDEKAREANQEALENAFKWASELGNDACALEEPTLPEGRLMLNGNEAIALGALSAGVKVAAFYPMTPSTSVNLGIIKHAEKMGVCVEQAEDEIAAVNMAIGASFAGAPAMAATSGGGYALMNEGLSLAGITETPLVLVVVQRPGPATGLPTRTEQGDLNFVLHGGHGEFPRAVFAPGTVEECFHLTRRAFFTAEKYQTPVFVMSDQFLADSYRSVEPFDADSLDAVSAGTDDPGETPYHRYAVAENGVSPRLLPGKTEHLVIADSDEHTEDGHLTEDLDARIRQQEKRMKKQDGLVSEFLEPTYHGPEKPDTMLVCWGSTLGAAVEAAEKMTSGDAKAAVLHFPQVWPLDESKFRKYFEDAGRVVSVEGNQTGQFARLLRAETGITVDAGVNRYDGLPITPAYIIENLEK